MTPRAFSFNSPHGACQECQGLGAVYDFDPARVVPDDTLSLEAGAIAPWAKGDRKLVQEVLESLSRASASISAVPFRRLPKKLRDVLFFGAGAREASGRRRRRNAEGKRATRIRSAPDSRG